jgi:RNA polymerase sigma-70 factor (ECF subfamily)
VDALESLVRTQYLRLVRAVALASGAPRLAEEATQEALSRAWQRAAAGERFSNLAGWVTVVGANEARSRMRREQAEERAVTRLSRDPSRVVGSDEFHFGERAEVRGAVASLPDRQRQVVVLYYYLRLRITEIADELDVTEGAVKNALFRARLTLARALGEVAPMTEVSND